MHQNIQQLTVQSILACLLTGAVLLTAGCRKEKAVAPSDLDENYFVIRDNPNDPVDHAIYQFYQKTGVASFYNDTIHRRQVGDSAGIPRYAYIKLSLNYELFGIHRYNFTPIASKAELPALLDLLEEQLLPKLPENLQVPSFLFVDSFWNEFPLMDKELHSGWSSWHGFNTVAIKVEDVQVMSNEEKNWYVASILAGILEKRLNTRYQEELLQSFFSVSAEPGFALLQYDIYIALPFALFGLDPSTLPPPEELGFLRYIASGMFGIPDPLYTTCAPRQTDDLRAFLAAIVNYSTSAFNQEYAGYPLVLQKANVLRNFLQKEGFKFAE